MATDEETVQQALVKEASTQNERPTHRTRLWSKIVRTKQSRRALGQPGIGLGLEVLIHALCPGISFRPSNRPSSVEAGKGAPMITWSTRVVVQSSGRCPTIDTSCGAWRSNVVELLLCSYKLWVVGVFLIWSKSKTDLLAPWWLGHVLSSKAASPTSTAGPVGTLVAEGAENSRSIIWAIWIEPDGARLIGLAVSGATLGEVVRDLGLVKSVSGSEIKFWGKSKPVMHYLQILFGHGDENKEVSLLNTLFNHAGLYNICILK